MNRWDTPTGHSLFSAIQLSAYCCLHRQGAMRAPTLPWETSARPECITVNMANAQAVVHFAKAACSFRPYTNFLHATRGFRHLLGCLFCAQVRGDKIIVFSDNIFSLRNYAVVLKKPFIYGGTSHAERTRVLHAFKHNPQVSYPSAPSSFLHHTSPHLMHLHNVKTRFYCP